MFPCVGAPTPKSSNSVVVFDRETIGFGLITQFWETHNAILRYLAQPGSIPFRLMFVAFHDIWCLYLSPRKSAEIAALRYEHSPAPLRRWGLKFLWFTMLSDVSWCFHDASSMVHQRLMATPRCQGLIIWKNWDWASEGLQQSSTKGLWSILGLYKGKKLGDPWKWTGLL